MNRVTLLNQLLNRYGGQSAYLEIGCRRNQTFRRIQAAHKVGVDPASGGTVRATSDQYFADCRQWFDVVFIDGLHRREQVLRDVDHALSHLLPGGVIVLHDCLPPHHEAQQRDQLRPHWNGDVWRAALAIRQRPDVDFITVDADQGLGVLVQRPNSDRLPETGFIDFSPEGVRQRLRVVPPHFDVLGWVRQRRLADAIPSSELRHVIATRFAIQTPWRPWERVVSEWVEHRFALFERFTLPSIVAQSLGRLEWFLMVDPRLPSPFRERLEACCFDPRIRLVACPHDRRWQDELASALIESHSGQQYLITSRVDSDDALTPRYVESVQSAFIPQRAPEWLDAPLGIEWSNGSAAPCRYRRNPFQTLVAPFKGAETPHVYCTSHETTHRRFHVRSIENSQPMWIRVLHGQNAKSRPRRPTAE